MIGAGRFDRRIRIERAAESRDPGTNAVLETWATHMADVPASIARAPGREFLEAAQIVSERRCVFTVRYADIRVTDRVIADDGLTYDIRDIREIGRRRFLELHAEALS